MKQLIIFALILSLGMFSCNIKNEKSDRITVGIFDKNGDSPYCIVDADEALKIDPLIDTKIVSASDIVSGVIDDFDVLLFPGGSGRSETFSLGEIGMEKVIDLVENNGLGIIGICAGAYISTKTPDYPCFGFNGCEAIDIEHDNRGHGLAKFSLTEEGFNIFPELKGRDISFCQYYEGPVLIPASEGVKFNSLATMLSDVHTVEGTPSDMTNNRPFIVSSQFGKGKSVSFVGHPECTSGMRWMIPRVARWIANKEFINYPKSVVRPDFYKEEIIYTSEIQSLQSKYKKQLEGSKEEKLDAIDNIIKLACWSSKKWIPAMLRDSDKEVRLKAAKATVLLERTDAIKDIKAAILVEKDPEYRTELKRCLHELKNMLGKHRIKC